METNLVTQEDIPITEVNPYVQNIAETSMDNLNQKVNYDFTEDSVVNEQFSQYSDVNTTTYQHYKETTTIENGNIQSTVTETSYIEEQQQQVPDMQAVHHTGIITGQEMENVPQDNAAQQDTNYMLEHGSENIYMPDNSQTVQAAVAAPPLVTEEGQQATYGYEEQQVTENYVTEEPVMTETVYQSEYAVNNPPELQKQQESNTVDQSEKIMETEPETVEQNVKQEATHHENVLANTAENIEGNVSEEPVGNLVIEEEQPQDVSAEPMDQSGGAGFKTELVEESNVQENIGNAQEAVENTQAASLAPDFIVPSEIQSTEVIQADENQYTIAEHSKQTYEENADDPLQLLGSVEENYEETSQVQSEDQTFMSEVRSESRCSTASSTEVKKKRGRKPTYEIPMHVLGHDMSKPVETVSNGRSPKPRLGVKVPNRNLTSQIVSREEIQREIVERSRKKQEMSVSKGDVIFARKLTQRLARKIAPSATLADEPSKTSEENQNPDDPTPSETPPNPDEEKQETPNPLPANEAEKIQDNSDLLAILEGDGEDMPVLSQEVTQPVVDESNLRNLEREIALQQLHDLPYLSPKQRTFRGRQCKDSKAPLLTPENKSPLKSSSVSTSNPAGKEKTTPKEEERFRTAKSGPVEIEPQIKVNMALKTYSRKRKLSSTSESFELPDKKPLVSVKTEPQRSDIVGPPDAYVTKSSRVIKKKVIWDPDDDTPRSPKPLVKESPSKVVGKPLEKVEKKPERSPVAEKKPVIEKPKSVEKKTEEKPVKKIPPADLEKKIISPKSLKPKKGRSEVDKLLGDEGAIKMLYELKSSDEPEAKKKRNVISVDRTYKDLMKKANEIKNELENNTSQESPKSLRKKEALSPVAAAGKPVVQAGGLTRQKSKDSTRSSIQTPPQSPTFPYPNAETTYLIRRRSSSSMSSGDDLDDLEEKIPRKKSDSQKLKKFKKQTEVKERVEDKEKTKQMPVEKEKEKSPQKPNKSAEKLGQYKTFAVKKSSKHISIELTYENENCRCSTLVLEELTAALKKFSKEKDCNVVSLTSSGKTFCLGLDYKSLVCEKEGERKKRAIELAELVEEFVKSLLYFPKVLVAGIQGECVGLGVTMLPLFDMVIASDTATFSTPYSTLGTVAEAGFLLTLPQLTPHGLAAELLYIDQKLTADDAFRRGLISKLCWPEKYQETLKGVLNSIAKGSKQSLEATKRQLRGSVLESTEAAINAQSKQLVEHWTSAECQKNFAKIESN